MSCLDRRRDALRRVQARLGPTPWSGRQAGVRLDSPEVGWAPRPARSVEVRQMASPVAIPHKADDPLREKLMVTPRALAALERQAERDDMTLSELVGCVLEKAASQLLIEESFRSIERGRLCDDDRAIELGFDIGGGDA